MSGVQSIQRAFALLRALSVGAAGVTELADRVDLPKSTVARLLSALDEEGAVEQLEIGGDYRLGPGLFDLAGAAVPGPTLIAAARPHLQDLTDQTKETSGLSVMQDDSVLYLDHVESEEEVQVRSWTGEQVPLNLVPSGLVMLAGMSTEELDAYLATPLTATTSRSLTDPAAIRERLQALRATGFVWVYAEFDDSINSVAAPIIDSSGETVGALHVHGPAYRFPETEHATRIGRLVKDAADKLATQLR